VVNREGGAFLVAVDAHLLVPPAGYAIAGYAWDWGDESPAGAGVATTHRYTEVRTYTITLTVTLAGGGTYVTSKETSMSSIKRVIPIKVATGTALTLEGTNLGDAGVITDKKVVVGGVDCTGTLTAGAAGADGVQTLTGAVVGDLSAVEFGALDVQLVSVPGGTVLATAEGAVQYLDTSGAEDRDNLQLGRMRKVYLNGRLVGFTEDEFTLDPTVEKLEHKPNSRRSKVRTFWVNQAMKVRFTLSEIIGENLALALAGDFDESTGLVTIPRREAPPEVSFLGEDAAGAVYSHPVCELDAPSQVVLNAGQVKKLPIVLDVLTIDVDGEEKFGYTQLPV